MDFAAVEPIKDHLTTQSIDYALEFVINCTIPCSTKDVL